MKIYYDIHFLLAAVLASTSLAVVLSSRNAKGRGFLVGNLAINLAVMGTYYTMNLLERTKTMAPETYQKFMTGWEGAVVDIVSLGGPAMLLLYVIGWSTNFSSAGVSAEEKAMEQAIINRCAFVGGAVLCGLNFMVGGHVPGGAIGGAIGGGVGSLIGMAVSAIGRSRSRPGQIQRPETLPKTPTGV